MLEKIKSAKSIHVVGVSGSEGAAIALFLQKMGVKFIGHDFSEKEKFEKNFKASHFGYPLSKRQKIFKCLSKIKDIRFKDEYLEGIDKADLIFVSQNFEAYSPNHKLKNLFDKNKSKFATITQLYFTLFPGRIIAVTGTNGKSTTAKLIAQIMELSTRQDSRQKKTKAWFTGNDRRNIQILDCLLDWQKNDTLTIEVSNRQLKFDLDGKPDIGVITNVTENHLNEYQDGFNEYKQGKYSLICNQDKKQFSVLNYDNSITRQFLKQTKATTLPFSTKQKLSSGVYLDDGWIVYKKGHVYLPKKVCLVDKIRLMGDHNLSNILAATSATLAAGVKPKIICEAISKFKGIPQRLELVAQKRGVRYIDDSASTSPDSAIAALRSFEKGSVWMIGGGDPKGMDFGPLAKEITKQKTHVVLLESPTQKLLSKELKGSKWKDVEVVKNLQQAIQFCAKNAREGECVLLSPSAAWFCYFQGKIPLGGKGFKFFVNKLA